MVKSQGLCGSCHLGEQCQALLSGLCAQENEVPGGFGGRGGGRKPPLARPWRAEGLFWEVEPSHWRPAPPFSPQAGQKCGAALAVLTSAVASSQHPSPPCHSPSASSLSLDRSRLLILAEDREGGIMVSRANATSKDEENLSLGREMAEKPSLQEAQKARPACGATNRLPRG